MLVRLLLPIAGLVSMYFLLRGHNAPGGGFVGGLVMATAIIAQYMVGGTIWVEVAPRSASADAGSGGLLAAGTAGISAWLVRCRSSRHRSFDLRFRCSAEFTCRACCCSISASTCSSSARRC